MGLTARAYNRPHQNAYEPTSRRYQETNTVYIRMGSCLGRICLVDRRAEDPGCLAPILFLGAGLMIVAILGELLLSDLLSTSPLATVWYRSFIAAAIAVFIVLLVNLAITYYRFLLVTGVDQ